MPTFWRLPGVFVPTAAVALWACSNNAQSNETKPKPTETPGLVSSSNPQPGPQPGTVPGTPAPLTPPTAPAGTDALAEGKQLYITYCALCHAPEGKGYAADNAPNLVSRSFLESADNNFIANGIIEGRPGTPMAPYGTRLGGPLNNAQVASIVGYLRATGGNPAPITLPIVPAGNAKTGATIYDTTCKKCHGDATVRMTAPQLMNAQFLATASDGFIAHAIKTGRDGTPMEPQKLSDVQIADVVAYLRSQQRVPLPATPQYAAPTGKEPPVINAKGKKPNFTLREGRFVPAADVAKALEAKQRMVIIDARPASEWSRGHIPGAIAGPYYDKNVFERVPNDGTWVLAYCACPHHASGEVVDELRRRGFKNTAVIDEGILVWKQRGYPIETAAVVQGAPGVIDGDKPAIDLHHGHAH